MVSIDFASPKGGLQACGPQASPTRTHGYLISWAMAPSLWPLALAQAMALAVAMPDAQAMASSPMPWPWNWVMAPSPRPWQWLGYWVVGIGYRVLGIFILSNTLDAVMGRRISL